ncbi:MAG: aromatic ring-hydroxylating oxygenase subunit alpha, partial [Alphaproteobacteria bacterium]
MANVDGILDQLVERARKPLREASGIPPESYRSPELFALERELIFAKDWLCPGRAADIPKPGDYITFSINDQPIFVIRGQDGTIRGFSNVCLHRMMRLLDGTGNRRRIACPYHAWTYDLDGRLLAAPHMKDAAGFDAKGLCLPAVRTELWEGWIYVTLDPEARSIATELSPLREVVAKYAMADYVPAVIQDHVWNTNWKLLSENFMEGYHLPIAHRTTVGAWFPEED